MSAELSTHRRLYDSFVKDHPRNLQNLAHEVEVAISIAVEAAIMDFAKGAVKSLRGLRLCAPGSEDHITHLIIGHERRTLKVCLDTKLRHAQYGSLLQMLFKFGVGGFEKKSVSLCHTKQMFITHWIEFRAAHVIY